MKGEIRMKQTYSKPVFMAEGFSFTESIAACDIQVGESVSPDMITVKSGDKVCNVGDNGHKPGKGTIPSQYYPINIFNDDNDPVSSGCDYDWDGKNILGPVDAEGKRPSYGDWGPAIYGAVANNDNHKPAYNGKTFHS